MCKLTYTICLVCSITLLNAQITVSNNLRLTGAVFLNVDGDFDATGGTINCVSKIIKSDYKEITGILVVAELIELEGRFKLDFPVESFIKL